MPEPVGVGVGIGHWDILLGNVFAWVRKQRGSEDGVEKTKRVGLGVGTKGRMALSMVEATTPMLTAAMKGYSAQQQAVRDGRERSIIEPITG